MSDGVEIPITVPGADIAKLALDQIVGSFSSLEQKVISLAAKSEATAIPLNELKTKFIEGKISAEEFRKALEGIASQASQVTKSVESSRPAFANFKTSASDARELANATREWSNASGGATEKVKAAGTNGAFAFNQITQAAQTTIGAVSRFTESVSTLAAEQSQLNANSTRLGLDFDRAAEAAGRFTDETEAMGAATRLAEAGIRLNQEQLDALTRVAARFAQNTGTTTASAIDTLTNGLITGSARGLRPFGGDLVRVSGESHTATERLAALTTQAAHTEQATDDAASSMARFVDSIDDAKRAMATAFSQGIADALTLTNAVDESGNKFEILTEDITNAGRIMGTVVVGIGNGIATVVGGVATGVSAMLAGVVAGAEAAGAVIDRLRAGHVTGLGAAAVAAARASVADSPITQGLMRFTAGRADAANRIADRGLAGDEGGTWGAREQRMADEAVAAGNAIAARAMGADRGGGGGGSSRADEQAKSAKADQLAAERAITAAYNAEHEALQRLRETETREADARDALHRAELDRLTDRLRAQQEREKAESVEGARAIRETERLHREQQRRLDMTQTYTERMRDLRAEEISSIQELAETTNMAFRTTGEALTTHLQAFADGEETAAEAAQNMLADTLKNIGKEALVKAGFFFAEGLGNLAIFNFPGAATAFAASAAYAAVGGGLVAGGNALTDTNTLGQRKDAENRGHHGGGGAGTESAARLSKGGASGGDGGNVYNVMFGGPMYGTGGVRQAARQLGGVLNRGAVQGGVQLLPGVLMGGGAGS